MNKQQIDAKIADAKQYSDNFKPKRMWGKPPDSYWNGYWKGVAQAYEEIKKELEIVAPLENS